MSLTGKAPHGILILLLFGGFVLFGIGIFAVYLQYVNKNIELEQQISNLNLKVFKLQDSPKPFSDSVIKTIVSNASKIGNGNITNGTVSFPSGFFSLNDREWGMVNQTDDSVVITIRYKQAMSIKNIANVFTGCSQPNCYNWAVEGVSEDNIIVSLVPITQASENEISKRSVSGNTRVKELHITAARNEGVNKNIYWKKIQIEYNQ